MMMPVFQYLKELLVPKKMMDKIIEDSAQITINIIETMVQYFIEQMMRIFEMEMNGVMLFP